MYLGRVKDYQFFSEEIELCSESRLERVAKACQAVEESVWNPTSNFQDYIKKQSAVLFVVSGGQTVGFALFDIYIDGDSLVVAGNECMIMKEHHGKGLPTLFSAVLVTHIQKDNRARHYKRIYNSMTFISLTVNYKLMTAFQSYSFLTDKSSFEPDEQIIKATEHYLRKEGLESFSEAGGSVDKQNILSLFFARGAFPNAVTVPARMDKPKFVPADFDLARGDAFLFVCRISRFLFLGIYGKFILFRYSFRFSPRVKMRGRKPRENLIYTRRG
jgi:hypothetical protein